MQWTNLWRLIFWRRALACKGFAGAFLEIGQRCIAKVLVHIRKKDWWHLISDERVL